MNREKFDSMSTIEQVKFINNNLEEGLSLTKTCNTIGINRKTIKKRFEKINYFYNKNSNSYESQSNNTKVVQNTKVIKSGIKSDYKNNGTIINKSNIKNDEDLKELINMKDKLKEIIYKYEGGILIKELDLDRIPPKLKDEKINTGIKVYKGVYEEFNKVCKKYNALKKQDLISLAMFEFTERHKKHM